MAEDDNTVPDLLFLEDAYEPVEKGTDSVSTQRSHWISTHFFIVLTLTFFSSEKNMNICFEGSSMAFVKKLREVRLPARIALVK